MSDSFYSIRLDCQSRTKNSWMCQLKLPFPLLLSSQRCVLPKRETDLFIYSHFRVTPGTRVNRFKKTHPELQCWKGNLILLSYCIKEHCLYLLPTFISFVGSKCSVILSLPAHHTMQTSDQTFNRLIKSAFEVFCSVLMSSCYEFFSRFFLFFSHSLTSSLVGIG